MKIFFYATFSNDSDFLKIIKKKFNNHEIYTVNDEFDFESIDIAMIWKIPDKILKKLVNIKLIFSL